MSAAGSPPSTQRLKSPKKALGQMIIVLVAVGYWLFVWQLERVVYSPDSLGWWQRVVGLYPLFDILSPLVAVVAEFLSPRVLRHFIPLIVGWWFARTATKRFLESFYDLPDGATAGSLLGRLMSVGVPALAPDRLRRENFAQDRERDDLIRVGGPGRVAVSIGDAVVTERNGRFERVLGPGVHNLGRFEYPYAVIDVRPQERETDSAALVTSDGIEVTIAIGVTFQIDPGEEIPTKNEPFPFDRDAVRRAAYAETNVGELEINAWESLPLIVAVDQLRDIVAEYRFDELILSDQAGIHVHRMLRSEMERRLQAVLRNHGIVVRGARLGTLQPPEQVTQQHIDVWRAYWDNQQRLRQVEQTARAMERAEVIRAEAEATLIQAIVEGLQRVQRSGRGVKSKEIVALRLIETLENVVHQSEELVPLPDELLPTLENLRRQLLLESNPIDEGGEQS